MTAVDTLRTGQEVEPDFLREVVRWTVQDLMEAEVSAQIGAERYERAGDRTTYRNGYRAREWDTRVGTLELAVPKLRTGSSVPSWLEPRRRSEQALVAVPPIASSTRLRRSPLTAMSRSPSPVASAG